MKRHDIQNQRSTIRSCCFMLRVVPPYNLITPLNKINMKVFKLKLNNQVIVFETPEHLGTFLAEQIDGNLNDGESFDCNIKQEQMSKEDFKKLNEFEGVPLT